MSCDVLILKDRIVVLSEQLHNFLKAAPGDQLNFEFYENGMSRLKKFKVSLLS